MSDPIRLLSGGTSEFERDLLSSARDDHAPLDAEERALASLGVGVLALTVAASAPGLGGGAAGASAATTATTASTTAASFAPAGLPSAVPAALKITGLAFAKWIGVGVIALAAAAGTYEVVATRSSARGTAPGSQPAPLGQVMPVGQHVGGVAPVVQSAAIAQVVNTPETQAPTPAMQPAGAIEQPAPRLADIAVAAVDPADPAMLVKVAAPPSLGASSGAAAGSQGGGELAGEVTLLVEARSALSQRDAVAANAALDEYARRYPAGTMREEATVARIESLLLAGQSTAAATQAEQFLREHPASTNTKRVRQLKKRATATE